MVALVEEKNTTKIDTFAGAVLATLRKEQAYSQEQVAQKLNVSRARVSEIETSKHEPMLSSIVSYCQAIGVSPAKFLELYLKTIPPISQYLG